MKMTIHLEDGGWMVTDDSAETFDLFGTNTLPTPFLAGTPASLVIDTLERLNPGADISIRR